MRLAKIVGFNNLRENFEIFFNSTDKLPLWMQKLKVKNWFDSVRIIHIFCDPVKRLLSEYVHVKSQHAHEWSLNAKFIGKGSQLYPFDGISFDEFVKTYLPTYPNLPERINTMLSVESILMFSSLLSTNYFTLEIYLNLFRAST